MFEAIFVVFKSQGKEQAGAIEQVHEKLKLLEEGIKGCFPGGSPTINGDSMGLLDITMCSIFGPHKVQEEVLDVRFIDPEKYPFVSSWVKSMTELPLVKELTPYQKLLDFSDMPERRPSSLQKLKLSQKKDALQYS